MTAPPPMSIIVRALVLKYHHEGLSVRQITAKIAEIGHSYHFTTIHHFLAKHGTSLKLPRMTIAA
jgi:hypothetical protein